IVLFSLRRRHFMSIAQANGPHNPELDPAPKVSAASTGTATSCPATTLDHLVGQQLDEIQAGWSDPDLSVWLYDKFLATLADTSDLSEATLVRHIDSLIPSLRGR